MLETKERILRANLSYEQQRFGEAARWYRESLAHTDRSSNGRARIRPQPRTPSSWERWPRHYRTANGRRPFRKRRWAHSIPAPPSSWLSAPMNWSSWTSSKPFPSTSRACRSSKSSTAPITRSWSTFQIGEAEAELSERRFDAAMRLLTRGRAIAEAAFGPEHPAVGEARWMLGRVLIADGRLHEALPQLKQRAPSSRRRTGAIPTAPPCPDRSRRSPGVARSTAPARSTCISPRSPRLRARLASRAND